MSLPDTSKAYLEKIELKAGDEKLPAKIHLDGFASSPEVITSLFEKWGGLKQDVPLAAAVPVNGRTLLPVDAKAKGLRTLSGKDAVGKESLVVASKTSPTPATQVPVKDAKSAPATKTAVGKSASKEVAKQSRYRISPNGTEQNGQISGFAHRFMPDITLTEPISDAEYQTVTADWKSALAKLTPTGMRRETVSLQTRSSTPRGPAASPAVANGVPTAEVSGAPGVATPATGGPVVIGAPGGASPVMNVTVQVQAIAMHRLRKEVHSTSLPLLWSKNHSKNARRRSRRCQNRCRTKCVIESKRWRRKRADDRQYKTTGWAAWRDRHWLRSVSGRQRLRDQALACARGRTCAQRA